MAPTSTASRMSAPARSAPERSAPARLAPLKFTCLRLARTSLASLRMASLKSAFTAMMPDSLDRSRFAPARIAPRASPLRVSCSWMRRPLSRSSEAMAPSRRSASNRSAPDRLAPRRQDPRRSARRSEASVKLLPCMSAPKKLALSSFVPTSLQSTRCAPVKSASHRLRPERSSPCNSHQAKTARAPPIRAENRRSCLAQMISTSCCVRRRRELFGAGTATMERLLWRQPYAPPGLTPSFQR